MILHETGVSLVSKLHDEILWHIFQLNSCPPNFCRDRGRMYQIFDRQNIRSAPPLLTNQATSQVCRQWRRVMVRSASIWANAVELEYLNQTGDDWRREVLIRTGEAPLTVIGRIGYVHNLRTIPFVMDLLDSHWKRIQTLIIASYCEDIDEKLCNVLSRPAPNLREFFVSLYTQSRVRNNGTPFMDHAPNLQTLRTNSLSFNLSGPSWSSTIRHLELEYQDGVISIAELLQGLERMTSLEVLRLSGITRNSDRNVTANPMIKLLALQRFTIADCELVVPDLLPYMIISPQCIVNSQGDAMTIHELDCARIALGYGPFFKNNFAHSTLTHVTYSLRYRKFAADRRDYIYFFEVSFGDDSAESDRFAYRANADSISNILLCMAEALLSCDLSNVTTLTLFLNTEPSENIVAVNRLFQRMYNFLLSLNSVKTLHTDEHTLDSYMASEILCATTVLLPNLNTVYTNLMGDGIMNFLQYRHHYADLPSNGFGFDVKHIKRLLFSKDSPGSRDNETFIGLAAMMGLSFGREGYDD